MMRFLLFASLCALSLAAKVTDLKTNTKVEVSQKAASNAVNYQCQCSGLTFRENGKIHGNCKSVDETRANWCYLPATGFTTCSDIHQSKQSSRFPGRVWSYEACATPANNAGTGGFSAPQNGGFSAPQNGGFSAPQTGNNCGNGVNDRAASQVVNVGCQCHSLSFTDKFGRTHGNCKSVDKTGAKWCYLLTTGTTTCSDIQRGSVRFPNRIWSYEACATPAGNSGGNGNLDPAPQNNCNFGNNGNNGNFGNNGNNGNFGNNGNNGNFGNNGNNGNFGNNGNSGTNCRQGSGCTGNFGTGNNGNFGTGNNGNNGNFGNNGNSGTNCRQGSGCTGNFGTGNNGNFGTGNNGNGNNGNFGNGNNGVDDRSGGSSNVAFGGATSAAGGGVKDRSKTKPESAIKFGVQ